MFSHSPSSLTRAKPLEKLFALSDMGYFNAPVFIQADTLNLKAFFTGNINITGCTQSIH
jgi:hypothetical protein